MEVGLELDGSLVVRALHVLAATFVIGVPAALFLVLRAGPAPGDIGTLVARAEQLQWVALGTLVATGVGNLAAMGDLLPDPGTSWARVLATKLGFVLLLLVVSAIRTFVIASVEAGDAIQRARLGSWYGATGGIAIVIVGLAEMLAHG